MLTYSLIALGAWLYFVVWFFAASRYLAMKDDEKTWSKVPFVYQVSLLAGLLPGLVLDVLFNWTYGTIHFREFPKELMFTHRVKRWVRTTGQPLDIKDNERRNKALRWKEILNAIEPGHVK